MSQAFLIAGLSLITEGTIENIDEKLKPYGLISSPIRDGASETRYYVRRLSDPANTTRYEMVNNRGGFPGRLFDLGQPIYVSVGRIIGSCFLSSRKHVDTGKQSLGILEIENALREVKVDIPEASVLLISSS